MQFVHFSSATNAPHWSVGLRSVGLILPAVVLAICAAWMRHGSADANQQLIAFQASRQAMDLVSAELPDFTKSLPTILQTDSLIRVATKSAAVNEVLLKEVSVDARSGTDDSLSQADLMFEARGTYIHVKAWIDGLRSRHSGLALQTLDIRRDAPGLANASPAPSGVTQTQASVRFRLFAQPTIKASSPAAGRTPARP